MLENVAKLHECYNEDVFISTEQKYSYTYSYISYCIALKTLLFLGQCDKPTYLFVQVVLKNATSLTHLLPTAVASCVAGLYGFVPRVRLNRLNWPKVVKMGSTPKKKRSFVEMVTQVVVATQVPRYPELILSLATVILRGISSVVRSMPCY